MAFWRMEFGGEPSESLAETPGVEGLESQAESRNRWVHRSDDPRSHAHMYIIGPCGQRLTVAGLGLRVFQPMRLRVIPAYSQRWQGAIRALALSRVGLLGLDSLYQVLGSGGMGLGSMLMRRARNMGLMRQAGEQYPLCFCPQTCAVCYTWSQDAVASD